MSYDANIYLATFDNPAGPTLLPEPIDWAEVNEDLGNASETEDASSSAVTVAWFINAVILLAFVCWLLPLIF